LPAYEKEISSGVEALHVNTSSGGSTPTGRSPTPSSGSSSAGVRRPTSGRGNSGGLRGEFRFSPNLIKLQQLPSIQQTSNSFSPASQSPATTITSLPSQTSSPATTPSSHRTPDEFDFMSPTEESLAIDTSDFANELSNLT